MNDKINQIFVFFSKKLFLTIFCEFLAIKFQLMIKLSFRFCWPRFNLSIKMLSLMDSANLLSYTRFWLNHIIIFLLISYWYFWRKTILKKYRAGAKKYFFQLIIKNHPKIFFGLLTWPKNAYFGMFWLIFWIPHFGDSVDSKLFFSCAVEFVSLRRWKSGKIGRNSKNLPLSS